MSFWNDNFQVPAPDRLRVVSDPPVAMWMIGNPAALDGPSVAIVGGRAATVYGRAMARKLAVELARNGITVISGFARGIDSEAHRGCLDMRGSTVAVFGCGIDRCYPRANAELAERIVGKGGLLMSEYEPGVEPAPWRFPARNRIVAALADAVVVVEARERSGSLITADYALEYGTPLFAFPGEAGVSTSVGSNRLLKDGHARMCETADDVLDVLAYSRTTKEVSA